MSEPTEPESTYTTGRHTRRTLIARVRALRTEHRAERNALREKQLKLVIFMCTSGGGHHYKRWRPNTQLDDHDEPATEFRDCCVCNMQDIRLKPVEGGV